jgi:hypothetical protein
LHLLRLGAALRFGCGFAAALRLCVKSHPKNTVVEPPTVRGRQKPAWRSSRLFPHTMEIEDNTIQLKTDDLSRQFQWN